MSGNKFNFECVRERYGSVGEDTARRICTMYRPETADWLASLWDGKVGAFYYATSSRLTDGYLPDSESTIQALGLLELLGLINSRIELPSGMTKKLGEFAYALQDPNGYFYHPQWKEMMLSDPERFNSRRGRDFGQCLGLIRSAGMEPKYPTALDNLKKAASGAEVSENAMLPDYLRSREAFVAHLDKMNINVGSYAKGHWISSQAAQITAAGLADVCIEYMASKQNPKNGTWEEQVDINSINGVTKIGTAFTSLGARIPNASVAFKSAISVALTTSKGAAVTAAYNPLWTMMQMLNGFKSGNMTEEYNEARGLLFDNGAEIISAAEAKLRPYYHEGESAFHYCHNGSSSTSQNVPASLGLYEGDVNATSLGIDTIVRIFNLLELPIGKPCNKNDGEAFFRKINEI